MNTIQTTAKTLIQAALLSTAVLLTACGGGSGGSGDSSSATVTASSNQTVTSNTPENNYAVSQPTEVPEQKTNQLLVNWSAPTERENGDALYLYELSGYLLQYRLSGSSDEFISVTINDPETTDITLALSEGEYELRIAAIDIEGIYSDFSSTLFASTSIN